MLKILIFLLITVQLSNAESTKCTPTKKLRLNGKAISLCEKIKGIQYISKECIDSPEKCFLVDGIKLEIRPNQSPGFSLCYDIEGEPFFGEIEGEEDKVPLCKFKGNYIDHDWLIKIYKEKNK